MKALLTLVLLGLFNSGSTVAQVSNASFTQPDTANVPASHLMKHAVFVCPDTIYQVTYELAEAFDHVSFYRGWIGPELFHLNGLATVDTSGHGLVFRAELLPGVDTLRSYFATNSYEPVITSEDGQYSDDPLTVDAFLSYALHAYGVTILDTTTAYFFGQLETEPHSTEDRYLLCEVVGWNDPSATYRYTVGHLAVDGFEVIDSDTLIILPKDMANLQRQLKKFVGAKWESCILNAEENLDLLVVGSNKVILPDHRRDWKKLPRRPEAIIGIPWIYWKYSQPPRDFFGFRKNK